MYVSTFFHFDKMPTFSHFESTVLGALFLANYTFLFSTDLLSK